MTRKQAISRAIDILSQDKQNHDIVLKLQEIYSELPLSHWTRQSIIDAIETYALEHNNILPNVSEFTSKNKLPSGTVINAKFNISSIDFFLKKYFSNLNKKNKINSPYKDKEKEFFINIFKDNYTIIKNKLNVKSVSARAYNKHRKKHTPLYETIIRQCGFDSYEDLLIECGYKNPHTPFSFSLNISYNDINNNTNDILNDIIKSVKK